MEETDIFGRSWAGRRVTVVGLGRSGMAAARLLHRLGCRVSITEARQTPEREAACTALNALGLEHAEVGGHTERSIDQAQLLVVSPGVAESAGPIQWATARRIPILSEIDLAFQFCPSPVVAVTGTNGKSTAVTLIRDILAASGRTAVACGNLGVPFASVLDQLDAETVAVVEVSSFQLLRCEAFRPAVAVLLNVGANHLDRHQDPQAYLQAKLRIFARQTAEDWAVLNGTDPRLAGLETSLHARCVWFGDNRSNPPHLRLAPETLRALNDNAQAVLQVARLMGVPDPLSWQVMRSFRGLEHRLEYVATIHGIHFINDSKSTTPDSLLFALRRTPGDLVVILGGRDKGLMFEPIAEPLHDNRVRGVVLIGESRPRLRALFNGSPAVHESRTLEEAVRTAAELSHPGTTVLFSPACASFDMFRDFEDRGRVFKSIVRGLMG